MSGATLLADATRPSVEDLENPRLFVQKASRNVFDAHDENRLIPIKDAAGKPVLGKDGQPQYQTKLRRFDKQELEQIARNSNARDAIGNPCPLTIGHTIDGAPETDQPEIVGYARRFHVAWDATLGRYVVRATFYLRRDREAEASQYPRPSVELWERHGVFDPIALLKRTPERDVGQWVYSRSAGPRTTYTPVIHYRGGERPSIHVRPEQPIRYSMEANMPDMPDQTPILPPSADDPDAQLNDKVMKCIKQGYPHLDAMHSKYAADMAPPEAPPGPGVPGPTSEPPAFGVPPKKKEEIDTYRKNGDQPERYARLEKQLGEMHGRYCKSKLQELRSVHGVQFEEAEELPAMLLMDASGVDAYAEHMLRRYQKAPVGNSYLPIHQGSVHKTNETTRAQHDAAIKIHTAEGCGYDAALARIKGKAGN